MGMTKETIEHELALVRAIAASEPTAKQLQLMREEVATNRTLPVLCAWSLGRRQGWEDMLSR